MPIIRMPLDCNTELIEKDPIKNYTFLIITYTSFSFRINIHHFQRRKEFIPVITSEVTCEFILISLSYFYAYLIPTLQQRQFFIRSLVPVLLYSRIRFVINSELAFSCFHNQSQFRHIRFNQQVIQRTWTKYIDIQSPSIRRLH